MTQSNLTFTENHEIPEGYKKTEVGLIPEEWNIISLGELSIISRLAGAEYTTMWVEDDKGEIIALRGFNIGKNTINLRDVVRITSKLSKKLIRSKLCEYDVVYPCVGTIGNAAVIYENDKYHIQQNIARITPKRERLNSEYLASYLISELAHKEVARFNATSSQPNVLVSSLRQYRVPCPSTLEEQEKIAKVLSDTDALISELEKLIEKKQAIKTATMQELLTGKTRLPEFALHEDGTAKGYKESELGQIPEDWEVKKIGEFTDCTAGGTPSTSVKSYWGGQHPWMSSGELHLKRVLDVKERITDAGLKYSSTKYIPSDSVLMGLAGQGKTRGTVAISKIKLCTNQSIASIFPSEEHNTEYLYYNLDSRYEELRGLSTGDGGRGGLNLSIIRKLVIPFPSLNEQNMIAQVLSDLDRELEQISIKLAKLNKIKQGMMQELLTGKTRLV